MPRVKMPAQHRVLPFLETLCKALDKVFIDEVGPFGEFVVGEVRERWIAAGPRTRPSDVEDYVKMLAQEIPEPRQRTEFIARARELLGKYK
jgi:hypothetical protein